MSYALPDVMIRRQGREDAARQVMMSIDGLIGANVYNHKGARLGNIQDIVLDIHNSRLRYFILTTSGFLGFGERLLAVPWSALQLYPVDGRLVLDMESAQLSNAPGFDRNHWPNMSDSAWAASIHSYYGINQE